MRLQTKLVVIAGTMAPGVFPAVALGAAGGHPNHSTTRTAGVTQPRQVSSGRHLARRC